MRYALYNCWIALTPFSLLAPRANIEPASSSGRGLRTCVPAAFDTCAITIALGSESEIIPEPGPRPGLPEMLL